MKIHYLSTSSVPSTSADSVHVVKMCQALTNIGHDVNLFAYRGEETMEQIYAYYDVAGHFTVTDIGGPKMPGIKRFWRTIAARRFLRESRPDLFFGRDLYGLLGVMSAQIPIVFEIHTPPINRLDRSMISLLLNKPNTVRIVVISEALKSEYRRLYPSHQHKIIVAPDGADISTSTDEDAPTEWPGRKGILQLGYVGHLYPGKGAEVVFQLAERLPSWDFHIIGGDEDSVRRARAINRSDNLYFHGHVQHACITALLRRVDIALFPCQRRILSKGGVDIARWMSPMKVFEYMAAGKPMICSDLPVIREILTDRVNALLVPPDDPEQWADAITCLERDPTLRNELGKQAYQDVLTHYTWDRRARNVLEQLEPEHAALCAP